MFSLKINKRGSPNSPNKVRGGRKKIEKLISGGGKEPYLRVRFLKSVISVRYFTSVNSSNMLLNTELLNHLT